MFLTKPPRGSRTYRVQGEHGEPENRNIAEKEKNQGEHRAQGEHGEPENRERSLRK